MAKKDHSLRAAAKRMLELIESGVPLDEAAAVAANEHFLHGANKRNAMDLERDLALLESRCGIGPVQPGPYVAEMFRPDNFRPLSAQVNARFRDRLNAVAAAIQKMSRQSDHPGDAVAAKQG